MTKTAKYGSSRIEEVLKSHIFGQDEAVEKVLPYIHMYEAGFCAPHKPIASFMLLGPTGTGKTHLVRSLAFALHGNPENVLRVDCGEFQLDHEVAKLIGAPPGYLGHRETTPQFSQQKLNAVTSEKSNISIVLFDEVEKAAPSLERLLLGVLDRAQLKLGDNTTVNFERSMIFFTSNVGSREISDRNRGVGFGYAGGSAIAPRACNALQKAFLPEFLNRLDEQIPFAPLGEAEVERIFDRKVEEFHLLIALNKPEHSRFALRFTPAAKRYLVEKGISDRYGAREFNRVFRREVIFPLAKFSFDWGIYGGTLMMVDYKSGQIVVSPAAKAAV